MKVKITELHPDCLWKTAGYEKEIIGVEVETYTIRQSSAFPVGWYYGEFKHKENFPAQVIGGFKYIEVPEPSVMSELGGLIDEDRDWKYIAIEKALELALMAKVADLWQRRLIEANERIEKLEGLLNDRTPTSD